VSWTCLVQAFAKRGDFDEAKRAFDSMPEKNLVTWNAMLAAYVSRGHIDAGNLGECQRLFQSMPEHDIVSCTAILRVFAQLGDPGRAKSLFDSIPQTDLLAWTALLQAYAQNGQPERASKIFSSMPEWSGIEPDQSSFVSSLIACNHLGLLAAARDSFVSMRGDYGLAPRKEHLWLMIDALSRAGESEEAREL
ncbi:hypothetical protein SELMODRAFT_16502, partial [Selaginella moellendorffii]